MFFCTLTFAMLLCNSFVIFLFLLRYKSPPSLARDLALSNQADSLVPTQSWEARSLPLGYPYLRSIPYAFPRASERGKCYQKHRHPERSPHLSSRTQRGIFTGSHAPAWESIPMLNPVYIPTLEHRTERSAIKSTVTPSPALPCNPESSHSRHPERSEGSLLVPTLQRGNPYLCLIPYTFPR
jgi:hypothetical protein